MSSPLVAAAIPTYARKELLTRLIDTVPSEWRVFVSDNNASLLPLTEDLGSRVTVSHSPTLVPMFANWNRALSLVDEECTHVFIPSDDDLFLPDAGSKVRSALTQFPDADLFIFGCDFVDGDDKSWSGYRPERLEQLPAGEGFLRFQRGVDARMPGVLFRKAFLDRIGAFDERFELTAADSDLIQRAVLLGKTVLVPAVIGMYRVWPGSLTYARQATDQWMDEVRHWTGKIVSLLEQDGLGKRLGVDVGQFRDEILARNLIAGLNNLLAKGELSKARAFLARQPRLKRATWRSKLRLMKCGWKVRGA